MSAFLLWGLTKGSVLSREEQRVYCHGTGWYVRWNDAAGAQGPWG